MSDNYSDNQSDISVHNRVKTKDIAKNLKKPESTIRKYSQDLEKHGYQFTKDPNGARYFAPEDEAAMLEYIRFREEVKMSVDLAARAVVQRRIEATSNLSPDNTNVSDGIQATDTQQAIRYISEQIANLPSKEQINYLMDTTEKIFEQNIEIHKIYQEREKDKDKLIEEMQKQLQKEREESKQQMLDLYQKMESKIDSISNEKKGFFGRLFK
ncbi:hypothetical protein [Bacillus sp. Brlt_9]|uniref:hypothetical protein n=1 Tax=Bacillus sp. Brlt_9 TaxID=3110916 RepID=UPI003F7C3975